MKEGWYQDDYLILFNESEAASASDRYAISQVFPGYQVVGLRGWDDFILRDPSGQTYCVPTVPMTRQYLSAFSLSAKAEGALQSDVRFSGKIKWYVLPVVFGGDPKMGDNIIWVGHEQHAQLVKWWNTKYRELKR